MEAAKKTKSGASKKAVSKKTTASKTTKATGADLIIVESPTKAKKISQFFAGKYNVIASNGHVRDLPKSTLGIDVENGYKPKYMPVRGKKDLIDSIKKSAKTAGHVYLATDPDREGEAISWHLAGMLGIDENSECRIVFNEITKDAVKASIKKPRAIDMDLVNAQQARRVLDRLVGYKISPILWSKVKRGLSAGRVQSVATRMICDREDEINAFVPEEYWTITAMLDFSVSKKLIPAKFYGLNGKKTELHSEEETKDVLNKIKDNPFVITDIKVSQRSKSAVPPFTTSSLQQEASRKLNMSTDRTMKTAQELYEGASTDTGLITYMRTDSVRISAEAANDALEFIRANYGQEYAPEKPNFYRSKRNAQDAHEAIRPTSLKNTPAKMKDKLTPMQYRLYKLIYDRFIASQMTNALLENTTVTYDVNNCTFKTNGQRVLFNGFMVIYSDTGDDNADDEKVTLPKLETGMSGNAKEIKDEQHFTAPPARYSEASLVKALDELGIGRPSTYAPTISTIIARNYIKREKKILYPTELGAIVTSIMKDNFTDIVDLRFTAEMEEKLDKVEEGSEEWTELIDRFYIPFEKTVQKAESEIDRVKLPDEVSDVPCDKCGAMMVYKMGRYGRFLACPNYPECKNTKPIVEKISTPCPKCGAAVVKKMTKTKKVFFGCERYPDCDFTSWDMPLNEKCPTCGAFMVQHVGVKGRFKCCSNTECPSRTRRKKTSEADEK